MPSTKLKKNNWLILFPLILSAVLSFHQLGVPDLNGDEYDLGYQAYNLVDGIFAGRKAYALSFSAHPPLPMYIQHFTLNVLNPQGLDTLPDEIYRFAPAILGVLTVLIMYILTIELFGSVKLAIISSSLLAVNNYHLFLSRIFHREAFLTFFVALALYFLVVHFRTKQDRSLLMSAIFAAAALLVKETAAILIIVTTAILFVRQENLKVITKYFLCAGTIFLPVIVYNLAAYRLTGYSDIFFAKFLGAKVHPGASPIVFAPADNFFRIGALLLDQFGIFVFAALGLALLVAIRHIRRNSNDLFVFFIVGNIFLFSFIGMRIYYLSFLTLPLIILLVGETNKLLKKRKIIFSLAISFLFGQSLFYSQNTLFNQTNKISEAYTEIYPNPKIFWAKNYSLTTRGFLENRGWKKLSAALESGYQKNDCLQMPSKIRAQKNLQLRRYLLVDDKIKEYYLGSSYNPKYQFCSDIKQKEMVWQINYDQTGVSYESSFLKFR